MNLLELLFWAMAIGTGMGLGIAGAQHHGIGGFVCGFIGGVSGLFILLGVSEFILPQKPVISARERNRRLHEQTIKTESPSGGDFADGAASRK